MNSNATVRLMHYCTILVTRSTCRYILLSQFVLLRFMIDCYEFKIEYKYGVSREIDSIDLHVNRFVRIQNRN